MEKIQYYLKMGFDAISDIRVSGDDVEKMAVAREALRNAWNACNALKTAQETPKESGENSNGG